MNRYLLRFFTLVFIGIVSGSFPYCAFADYEYEQQNQENPGYANQENPQQVSDEQAINPVNEEIKEEEIKSNVDLIVNDYLKIKGNVDQPSKTKESNIEGKLKKAEQLLAELQALGGRGVKKTSKSSQEEGDEEQSKNRKKHNKSRRKNSYKSSSKRNGRHKFYGGHEKLGYPNGIYTVKNIKLSKDNISRYLKRTKLPSPGGKYKVKSYGVKPGKNNYPVVYKIKSYGTTKSDLQNDNAEQIGKKYTIKPGKHPESSAESTGYFKNKSGCEASNGCGG